MVKQEGFGIKIKVVLLVHLIVMIFTLCSLERNSRWRINENIERFVFHLFDQTFNFGLVECVAVYDNRKD